jgi:cation diffusion facilitator family transporter
MNSTHDLSGWRHTHAFHAGNAASERRTWIVVGITAVTMVAEIVGGWLTGSMALTADGWHMATHVVALSIAGIAYLLARRWSTDERFTFGTWKIEVLGSFSSALLLGVVAIGMVVESARRLVSPEPISYEPALAVATIGLLVNLVSAWVLQGDHHPGDHADHGHDHGHHDHHHHHDLNLRSAYVHVVADAFTSVLAIAALLAGCGPAGRGWTP